MGKVKNLKTGEDSKQLNEFKNKTGLVKMEEIKKLPITTIQLLEKKIELMNNYAIANQRLVDLFGAVGGRMVNALNVYIDLQAKLLELEDECKLRKENPLENRGWLKAREMLANEIKFIHKHGLDTADVQSKIETRKHKRNEDIIFEVDSKSDKEDE